MQLVSLSLVARVWRGEWRGEYKTRQLESKQNRFFKHVLAEEFKLLMKCTVSYILKCNHFPARLYLHVYSVVNGVVNGMVNRIKPWRLGMREKTYHVQSYPITITPRLGTRVWKNATNTG